MNVPSQAQPIIRTPGATAPAEVRYEVFPSNGCPSGQWCCAGNGSSGTCVSCGSTPCLQPASTVCAAYCMYPSDC